MFRLNRAIPSVLLLCLLMVGTAFSADGAGDNNWLAMGKAWVGINLVAAGALTCYANRTAIIDGAVAGQQALAPLGTACLNFGVGMKDLGLAFGRIGYAGGKLGIVVICGLAQAFKNTAEFMHNHPEGTLGYALGVASCIAYVSYDKYSQTQADNRTIERAGRSASFARRFIGAVFGR